MSELEDLLKSKVKPKEKMLLIEEHLRKDKQLTADNLSLLKKLKGSDKGNFLSAITAITKDKPKYVEGQLDLIIEMILDKAPRVRWEASEIIANLAGTYPDDVVKAIPMLMGNTSFDGTVVKWSAALALTEIAKANPLTRKKLIPLFKDMAANEESKGIKTIYQKALKVLEKREIGDLTMAKLDFKKEFKQLFNPSVKQAEIVDVPAMNFLMVDGAGDPNTAIEFQQAMEVLYSVSYTLKFMLKEKPYSMDYVVAPSEGLWWCDRMEDFSQDRKDLWKWTVMIMQPPQADEAAIQRAMEAAAKKKDLPALSKLRFESFTEGKCAQIMHLGPYAAEAPTILALHAFIAANGLKRRGKHHEIYLSDPRRAEPEKMKTVLRQPVE